jgi:CRP/FNR family nitrogen fixation transcriptional regulator
MDGIHEIASAAENRRPRHFGSAVPAGARAKPVDTIANFNEGQAIYSDGQPAGRIYEVERGAVRVYRTLADGRRQILAFHFSGDWFGFASDGVHHFSATAIGDAFIRSTSLAGACEFPGSLFPPMLCNLALSEQHQLVIGRTSACERVAAFLMEMAERQGRLNPLTLVMSRTDIADYLGLTNETVSRCISKLRARGIVRLRGANAIELVKWNALKDLCE